MTTLYAYVGCRTSANHLGKGITVYRTCPVSGKWTLVQLLSENCLPNPAFLAFDRTRRFLYAVHGDGSDISAFAVEERTGQLRFLNHQSTGGLNPVHLAIDPTNRFFVVANYTAGTVAIIPRNEEGTLAPPKAVVPLVGMEGPHKREQDGAHPHYSVFDPSGRFLLIADKGLDQVFVYGYERTHTSLLANTPSSVRCRDGAGPRHIAFHPTMPYVYISNELDSTITVYRWDSAGGRLAPIQIVSTAPSTFTVNNRTSHVAVGPLGRCLYAANRGHDSLVTYAVEENTGMLTTIGWTPTHGQQPRHFAHHPSARFLYVANERSHSIAMCRVNDVNGELTPSEIVTSTGSPTCIIFGQWREAVLNV